MGDDRGPRFVWPGVGPKLTSELISRKQRERDPLGARGLRLQSGLEFRGLGWQWIGWLVLAHVGELAGAGSQLYAGLGCWIGRDHGPDWQRTRAWDHAAGIAGLDCGLGLSYSLFLAINLNHVGRLLVPRPPAMNLLVKTLNLQYLLGGEWVMRHEANISSRRATSYEQLSSAKVYALPPENQRRRCHRSGEDSV